MSVEIVREARKVWGGIVNKEERAFRICNEVAAQLNSRDLRTGQAGWGIFVKHGGAGWNYKGYRLSLDLIFNNITRKGYDVLKDAENNAEAVWQEKTIVKMDDWIKAWRAPFPELLSGSVLIPDVPDTPDKPPDNPPDVPNTPPDTHVTDADFRALNDAVRALAFTLSEEIKRHDAQHAELITLLRAERNVNVSGAGGALRLGGKIGGPNV